jgi:hypothetical protein
VEQGPVVAIARLRSTWDAQVNPSARRACGALVVAVFFAAAHLGRLGNPLPRAVAAAAFGLTLVALVARGATLRRRRSNPRHVVRDTVARMDRDLAGATLRALSLVERTAVDPRVGSPALAGLHLERLIARTSLEKLGERAQQAALRWSGAGLALAAAAALLVLVEPFRVVEGIDVLAARDGDAPLRLPWVDEVVMGAAPPEYLHQPSSDVRPFRPTQQPRGTTLTVRGRPLHAGRPVVLTDGAHATPFVDDGAGHIVARWTVADSTSLWIAAEFGDSRVGGVRIRQAEEQAVVSIPDEAPRVTVEGAPRTVRLLEEPSIAIHYEATDDHGLREVDLVLRAGAREERRVLSHPAADVLVDRGGYEVQARDPFFKKVYTPVEITVEARDNDVVAGPKWGKSAAIVVLPPQVGEPEALRYQAMLKARDAFTDLTAFRVTEKAPLPTGAKAHLVKESEAQATAVRAVGEALFGSYGGLQVRGRMVALARGQLRRLGRALEAERKTPGAPKHQKLLEETEEGVLAFDAGVRALGYRDSQSVARRLADVAEDVAAGLNLLRGSGRHDGGFAPLKASVDAGGPNGEPAAALDALSGVSGLPTPGPGARIDAGIVVLDGGGKELLKLGDLGLDLGEIVANDLRRIARAREAHDLLHAELAARDLAARLRRPEPSFSGGGGHGGGRGGRGGVESGDPGGGADSSGEASSADDEAAAGERDLEDLAREHGEKIGEVEDALERAVSQEELEELKREAKEHAEAVREAVKKLPSPRGQTGSPEAAAAQAREEAEAMAGALEGGRPRDAVESGRRAVQKLGEAQRAAEQNGGLFPDDKAGKDAAAARPTLERELAWAEEALERLRRASSARAKGDLQRLSKDEHRLADKAREIEKRGESGDASMPQEMLDRLNDAEQAMRDAQRALQQGESENGLRRQRDAQRLLEMARGERDDGAEEEGRREGEGRRPTGKADVPGKDKHKGPEEFRKRVLRGLGGSSDPLLREAVKRYAEGLLK